MTPLVQAVRDGNEGAVSVLLLAGADPNQAAQPTLGLRPPLPGPEPIDILLGTDRLWETIEITPLGEAQEGSHTTVEHMLRQAGAKE